MLFWALLVLLSLLTFNANDPSLNHVVSGNVVISNRAGLFGAYLSGFLNDVFGIAAYIWPLVFGAVGAAYISTVYELLWWRWCGYFLLTLCLLSAGAAWDMSLGDIHGGGMVGRTLYENTQLYFSPGGSTLIWLFVGLIALQLAFDISWLGLLQRFWNYLARNLNFDNIPRPHIPRLALPKISSWREKFMDKPTSQDALPEVLVEPLPPVRTLADDEPFAEAVIPLPVNGAPQAATTPAPTASLTAEVETVPEDEMQKMQEAQAAQTGQMVMPVAAESSPPGAGDYAPAARTSAVAAPAARGKKALVPLPPLDLLNADKTVPPKNAREEMERKGRDLMACLDNFDVKSELVRVTPGPVVTMFEVRPAAGIRVSRIANLSDDLALALKAMAVRIQAPIPGSDTVGIEIPNATRQMVNFRGLLEGEEFRKSGGSLTMALGKDIAGRPFMADLARMPHLLVAGATGAGKSVCLNSILLSFLYSARPEDVRLLLVDPKRIEMSAYADLPHLVHPVVTEMSHAKTALDWAVHEMDQRFAALNRLKVRGLDAYNQKLASFGKNLPPDYADLEPLPYLVIVIDELADLMLTAAREVETSIVRLAQLARAAGIHMILATQRPSVDVVTGLIKANFPCRISFQVTSKHDSRTILDMVGAEYLLGKGDMLFKHGGGRLQRLHGPFVSDEEVQAVVGYWKRQLPPSYKVDFADWGNEAVGGVLGGGAGDAAQDPLYGEVQAFVTEQGKASISLIQRRFKIGFNRAARLVEQLERDGVIAPAEGGKSRQVVR